MTVRTKTPVADVSTVVSRLVQRDFAAAAKSNTVLSKTEQKSAKPYVRAAAEEIRKQKPGALVKLDAMEAAVAPRALSLIAEVNQAGGSGAKTLSQTEAKAAFKKDPVYGELILEAYEIASGRKADVDAVAEAYVSGGLDPDYTFRRFNTEAEALAWGERGANRVWLARGNDGAFVSGRNDLWSQRFTVDQVTGAVTVTHEH